MQIMGAPAAPDAREVCHSSDTLTFNQLDAIFAEEAAVMQKHIEHAQFMDYHGFSPDTARLRTLAQSEVCARRVPARSRLCTPCSTHTLLCQVVDPRPVQSEAVTQDSSEPDNWKNATQAVLLARGLSIDLVQLITAHVADLNPLTLAP